MAEQKKIDELALYGAFWRNNNFAGNYNFERLMALGMTQVMIPIFRSLGYTGDKLKDGYKRHLVFYNTHPYFGSLIMGVMAAMEEAKANDDSITTEVINDFKVAMMGPFAGVGDFLLLGHCPSHYPGDCRQPGDRGQFHGRGCGDADRCAGSGRHLLSLLLGI